MGEVRGELRKVVWPTKQEVWNSSIVVVIAVAFLTASHLRTRLRSAKFSCCSSSTDQMTDEAPDPFAAAFRSNPSPVPPTRVR